MTEKQADYIAESQDAIGMLGKGYEPAVEIETARKITERRGGKLVETERAAFVKIYTDFKQELKTLDGDDLKVWIYLALSVNRYTKDARPGLRKIAEDCGIAVNTVRACVERLETKHLLDVEKEGGKGNIYHPSDYVSVSKSDTVKKGTVSNSAVTVSKNGGTVSVTRKESAQLEELDQLEKDAATPLSPSRLQEIKTEANQDMDAMLAFEASKHVKRQGISWRGRELLPPHYLPYGDWWNSKTGQEMYGIKAKAKVNTEWLKAFKEWWENEVTIKVLEQVYAVEAKWKEVISRPSELTSKAIALQALPPEKESTKLSPLEQALFDLQRVSTHA